MAKDTVTQLDAEGGRGKRPRPTAADGSPGDPGVPPPSKRVVVLAILQHGDGMEASISRHTVEQVRGALADLDPEDRDNTILDVWLESGGGDAHSAYKIALMLRSVASFIRVVVPDYAKSAATLLSLVADEIYMAPAAELGPLDAQIGYEQEGITVSALDRARSLEDLTNQALDIAFMGGGMGVRYSRLSRADSLTAMLDFAAKFLEPVTAKLDPTILHWSNTLLSVATEYGKRLMLTREGCRPAQAEIIPKRLVEEYPSHGFVVSIDEAKGLGLPVRPTVEYDKLEAVKRLYSKAEEHELNIIAVVPTERSSATAPEGEGDEVGDNAGHGTVRESASGA